MGTVRSLIRWFPFVTLTCAASLAPADVLRVPADYPNIGAAVAAALRGDTVLVADAIYRGDGNTDVQLQSGITVRSENGPAHCIIDCEDQGWAFSLQATTTEDAITIEGFTILAARASAIRGTGAAETIIRNCVIRDCRDAPAVSVRLWIALENCLIENNRAGGFAADWAWLRMENCILRGNRSSTFGGGVRIDSGFAQIDGCTIRGNRSDQGGGIYSNSRMAIRDCLITGNEAEYAGGGIAGARVTLYNCRVTGNSASEGAGLSLGGNVSIDRCVVAYNHSSGGGAGLMFLGDALTISNSVFRGNRAGGDSDWRPAGGVYAAGTSIARFLFNCTFVDNEGGGGAGALYCDDARVALQNCILWNNAPQEIVLAGAAEADLRYCTIRGGWPGAGNTADDPLFEPASEARLSAQSPCIDAGDPAATPFSSGDIDGESRVMGGRIDIGADEYTARVFLFGDMNCDGARSAADIEWFITAMLNPSGYRTLMPDCEIANGDVNSDGILDTADIEPFIELLTAP